MAEEKTSNFKDANPDGTRRPGSIVGDLMDVRQKAALTPPEPGHVNEDGTFEGGAAPGEGTVAKDPRVQEAREEQEDG